MFNVKYQTNAATSILFSNYNNEDINSIIILLTNFYFFRQIVELKTANGKLYTFSSNGRHKRLDGRYYE